MTTPGPPTFTVRRARPQAWATAVIHNDEHDRREAEDDVGEIGDARRRRTGRQ